MAYKTLKEGTKSDKPLAHRALKEVTKKRNPTEKIREAFLF